MPQSPLIRRTLTVVVILGFLMNATAFAQTTSPARQLLDQMIAALGGKQFLDVKEIQTSGRFFGFKKDAVSSSDLYTDYLKFPNMDRTEFGKERQKTIQINRGLEGWMIRPSSNGKGEPDVTEQSSVETEEFLTNFRTSFDYVVRFAVNSPNTSLLHTGSESVDSRRADVLEVRDVDKNLMRIFIDRETRLPVKMQTRLAGNSVLQEESYANWHKFDGVMTPLMIVRYKGGVKTMEIRAEKAVYNAGFPDSLFAPPPTKSK